MLNFKISVNNKNKTSNCQTYYIYKQTQIKNTTTRNFKIVSLKCQDYIQTQRHNKQLNVKKQCFSTYFKLINFANSIKTLTCVCLLLNTQIVFRIPHSNNTNNKLSKLKLSYFENSNLQMFKIHGPASVLEYQKT